MMRDCVKHNFFEDIKRRGVQEDWYAHLKRQTEIFFNREIEILSQLIRENNIRAIVDIGFGSGEHLDCLSENLSLDVVGVEPDAYCFNSFKRSNPKSKAKIFNINFEEYEGKCQFLFMRFLLQHINVENIGLFIEKASEVLCPPGLVMIIDAAPIVVNKHLDLKLVSLIGSEFVEKYYTVQSIYAESDLIRSFEDAGFINCEIPSLKKKYISNCEKKLIFDLYFGAERIKAICLNKDSQVIDKLKKELEGLLINDLEITSQLNIWLFKFKVEGKK